MNQLETLLREHANSEIESANKHIGCSHSYAEHVNPDAIKGEDWLTNGTSYIWKVGVYGVVDGNKADWCSLYIGHQRSKTDAPEFIGRLFWHDGENDDVGRCLFRYLEAINGDFKMHAVFQDDDRKTPATPAEVIQSLYSEGFINGKAVRESLGKSDSLDAITPDDIARLIA